ncbi:DUF4124 domain-containing protein [Wenzhouxiangella sp. XN79A]|uniref:DUF4124 domain-containing protein n=1 Tax=Wenzhouxiangella sp. XN79A TaxID=2724193 RepID=UPI00144AEE18|nr:DUF4124 domain-containing protein [Wenzhouxiangella sp. XN79A]NKI35394.1 DUF4124 domain-containing protein [Wenzhouxiangella sp. XN79A]
MSRIKCLKFLPNPTAILVALVLSLILAPWAISVGQAQQIYKTVDENGNVVYTDQKPSDDAEPIPLPELTVVDPVDLGNPAVASDDDEPEPRTIEMSIVSPLADEVIINTAYRLDVEVEFDAELPRGVEIVYRIDGEERLTSRERSVTIDEVIRGPHTVSAELRTTDGRVLGRTEPVSFFMRQQSALYNRPG